MDIICIYFIRVKKKIFQYLIKEPNYMALLATPKDLNPSPKAHEFHNLGRVFLEKYMRVEKIQYILTIWPY